MASPQTLTPNTGALPAGWTRTGGTDVPTALADASDATYVENLGGTTILEVGYSTFALPALAQVRRLDWYARVQLPSYPTGAGDTIEFREKTEAVGDDRLLKQVISGTDVTSTAAILIYLASWTVPVAARGAAYIQALLDNRAITVQRLVGTTAFRLLLLQLLVYYNEAPVVSAVAASSVTTTRPTITWTYTDPELDAQERLRVKIFSAAQYGAGGFDPETSTATWDSGEVYSSTPSQMVGFDLLTGVTYKAYVKTADAGSAGRYSAWALSSPFTMSITAPLAPSPVLFYADSTLARVHLEATAGAFGSAQTIAIERSLDSGVTWSTVRGCGALPATPAVPVVAYDYEMPRKTLAWYRAKAMAVTGANNVVSGWSNVGVLEPNFSALETTGWWLKDPLDSSQNMALHVADFSFRQKEPQATYEPLGRTSSVVVSDGVKGIEGSLTVWLKRKEEYDALRAMLARGRTLWLEDTLARYWYVRFGATHEYQLIRAYPRVAEATPIRHFHQIKLSFVEVARPSGESPVWTAPQSFSYWNAA